MTADDLDSEPTSLGIFTMAALALGVGVVAGFGAVVFRGMISLFHNLLFHGHFSLTYDANVHSAISPWGVGIILVPVVGAVVVAFLVKTFAPEAKGHGVPEVMDAIYYDDGRIRPVVAIVKAIASAISIGSGGAVGREGPIIQIGSAFGSSLGQLIRMPVSQRITLISAGAAGGIAATFNTPIGGLVFAVELLLPSISASTLMPVALATVTSAYVGRYFLGLQPALSTPELVVPTISLDNLATYPFFALFGLVVGLLATLFIRAIYWFEDRFDSLPGNYYTRHVLGMFGVGSLIYGLMVWQGHYYVQGVGYATIEDILQGKLNSPGLLLLLVAAKLLATCLTLGSGASGGIFSPCLFLGATSGGAFGLIVQRAFPGLDINPVDFAIVGMAGMISGATGALVTSIVMLFEMTRDYNVILPLILTVAVAYIVRKHLSHASIYTLKLLRRGHVVPEGLAAARQAAHRAVDVMNDNFVVLPAETTLDQWPVTDPQTRDDPLVVLQREGHVVGVLPTRPFVFGVEVAEVALGDVAQTDYVFVREDELFLDILAAKESRGAHIALVTRSHFAGEAKDIIGVITHTEIALTVRSAAKLFR